MNDFGIKIFPNPAQNFIQFDAALSENTLVSATIYDLYGRLVLQIKDKKANELIDITGLANGVYILKLASAKQRVHNKFTNQWVKTHWNYSFQWVLTH